jgi:hypothetical protein
MEQGEGKEGQGAIKLAYCGRVSQKSGEDWEVEE